MNKHRFYIQNAIILFLCSAFVLPAAADQLYKWVDERGRVTYQSSPPPDDAAEVERPDISTTTNDAADEPTKEVAEVAEEAAEPTEEVAGEVAEEAAENEAVSITFFSNPDCISCEDLRAYLQENELDFEEIDIVENTEMAAEMQDKHGHNTVPTIVVGNKAITGGSVDDLVSLLKNSGFEDLLEQ